MISVEESVTRAMDGTDSGIYPFLPYILQDFTEIGTSPGEVIELIASHTAADPGLKVLDLGCGKGVVSMSVARRFGCRCTGIDAIPDFIHQAREMAARSGVEGLCEFRIGDIREDLVDLPAFDVIILGAIGPVFGDYCATLRTLKPHLCEDGIIIIDDAYTIGEEGAGDVLPKVELLKQVEAAGMRFAGEITVSDSDGQHEDYDRELSMIRQRCMELIEKYPDKSRLFEDYIENQRKEYETLETEVICSVMVIKKM